MRIFSPILSILLFGAMASNAWAADEPQWKLKDPYFVTVAIKKATETTGIGPDKQEEQDFNLSFEVTPQTRKAGGFILDYKLLNASSKSPNPAIPMLKKGIGESITFTLSKDMKLEKTEGVEKFLKKAMGKDFDKLPPNVVNFMTSAFSALFNVCIFDCYLPLPEEKKPTTNESELKLAGLVSMAVKRKITVKGPPAKGIASYEFTGDITLAGSKDDDDVLGIKITKMKLNKPAVYKGAINFDITIGRPVEVEVKTESDMDIDMEIKGMEFKAKTKEVSTTVFKFSDKKPERDD